MEVTELGMTMDVSPVHCWKADVPMEVTVPGITTVGSFELSAKVQSPIEVRELGRYTSANCVHSRNMYIIEYK